MYAQAVLAGILAVATPGISQQSRLPLELGITEGCDESCQQAVLSLSGHPARLDYRFELKWAVGSRSILWPGWTRAETPMEGTERFAVIARALDAVAQHPPGNWVGTPRELYNALVAIARNESALWRGVHEGRIRGPVGEACLVQVHPGNGYDLETLVGVGFEPTERCLRAGAEILASARNYCERKFQRRYDGALPVSELAEAWQLGDWFPGTIALYGSGIDCDGSREFVAARVSAYDKAWAAPLDGLDFDATLALELL